MDITWRPERDVYRSRLGFTLLELLVCIGIAAVLAGLLLPALSRARGQARQLQCAAEVRQLGVRIEMYARDNKGFVPFLYHQDSRENRLRTPGGFYFPSSAFETAGLYWTYSFMDEFAQGWLDEQILCPNDITSVAFGEWASAQRGEAPEQIAMPLERAISRAFYFHPGALRADFVPNARKRGRVARLSDVAYPSGKALLVEERPFHDAFEQGSTAEGLPLVSMPDALGRRMVTASDLSVLLRSVSESRAPVLPDYPPMPSLYPGDIEHYERLQRNSVTFLYTRDGVLGRDW